MTPTARMKTIEQFIGEATKVHGDTYDYSNVEYTGDKSKIKIICKEHGEFKQTAGVHTRGRGCWECGIIKRSQSSRKTTAQFIEQAKALHGDKYDYSKVMYNTSNIKVTIICKIHGEFNQTPNNHTHKTNKRGCSRCQLCPSCQLWQTHGVLCKYCSSTSIAGKKMREKTKEMDIVRYLKLNLPDNDFYHNKSVGTVCTKNDRENTNGHLFPDIRFDCGRFQLIVEIDEFKHRGAGYKCDERRMYDIIAKLGMRCVFIRYNPDAKESKRLILLEKIKKYLEIVDTSEIIFDDFGLKPEYMFY